MKRKKIYMKEMTNKFACDLFEGISLCSYINRKIFYEKLFYVFFYIYSLVVRTHTFFIERSVVFGARTPALHIKYNISIN